MGIFAFSSLSARSWTGVGEAGTSNPGFSGVNAEVKFPKSAKAEFPTFWFLVTSQLSRRLWSPFWAALVFSAGAAA